VRRIAVIPARAGSKRLPEKNIRDFCGTPMLGHILKAARDSGLFEVIHVSTESARVAEVASAVGFAPEFPRPADLAQDSTPILPVVRHAVEEYARRGRRFDVACLLYACAALVEPGDLRRASAMFEHLGGTKVVLSVTPFAVPIEWAYDLASDARMVALQPGMFKVRSQDLRRRYHDTGGFAFFPVTRLLDPAPHDDRDFHGFVLPRSRAVDIDDQEDWELAEQLYRGRGRS
jgi:pseudaminic acid cytidylyltransferase